MRFISYCPVAGKIRIRHFKAVVGVVFERHKLFRILCPCRFPVFGSVCDICFRIGIFNILIFRILCRYRQFHILYIEIALLYVHGSFHGFCPPSGIIPVCSDALCDIFIVFRI